MCGNAAGKRYTLSGAEAGTPLRHVTTAPMYDARPAAMPADYGTLRLAPKGAETCACGARVAQTELQAPAYFIAQLKAQMQVAQ